MYEFVVKSGPEAGRIYCLMESEGTIGRDLDNTIALTDAKVSRKHARFFSDGQGWWLSDLGSRNGTWVDGARVESQICLRSLSLVKIGSTAIQFIDSTMPQPLAEEAPAISGDTVEIPVSGSAGWPVAQEERGAEVLARSNDRLQRLLRYADLLQGCQGIGLLMERTVEAATQGLANSRVVPVLSESSDGKLRPWFSAQAAFAAMKDLPIAASVVRHALTKRAALLVTPPVRKTGAVSPSMAAHRIQTVIAVPVFSPSQKPAAGVLYADRRSPEDDFTRDDLEWLISLASIFGRTLESVRAFERVSRTLTALDRQVRRDRQILGSSAAIQEVLRQVEKVARSSATVLVTGESGSGKELVARALHGASERAGEPFEAINCAALAEGVVESELFGHVKGAFTGAVGDRPGRFELADGGTLFLDEVAELSDSCQAKLLRVLEDGKIRRVGDTQDRQVSVRVIAATHRDLAARVAEKRFREDLFFRLHVVAIRVPPLRERIEDIDPIATHFLEQFSDACGKRARRISPEAMELLKGHRWPGNVRELKNLIERLVVLSEKEILEAEDLPAEIRPGASLTKAPADASAGYPPTLSLEEVEDRHIRAVLDAAGGNRSRAAEKLGIDRSTLYAKLKKYGIEA